MSLARKLWIPALVALIAVPLAADQHEGKMSSEEAAMMAAWQEAGTPGEAHEQLAKAEGTWKMVVESWMDPSAPPMVSEGVSEQTMILGGRVLEQRIKSEMMGMPFDGLGMTGYDNLSGKYWSTWMDSMSTSCFISHGSYDEASDSITFHGDYQDPVTNETVPVRAVSREVSADEHVFEWYETRGGEELKTMVITYIRQ